MFFVVLILFCLGLKIRRGWWSSGWAVHCCIRDLSPSRECLSTPSWSSLLCALASAANPGPGALSFLCCFFLFSFSFS
jgi:hypothetical protein